MSQSPIKVGIVGYGGSARNFLLPYILPNAELEVYAFLQRAAAPSDPSASWPGKHCKIDFPKSKHYQTAEDFFSDEAIELVIITSHIDTHGTFAEKALKSGKHVVVEKPFTSTSEEADQLIALAAKGNKLLTVYQNRRWDGDFSTLRHLVEENAFGTVTEADIHYDVDRPSWIALLSAKEYTPGSGLMFGLGVHTIDQALLLFGRPKSVTCFLRNLRGIESDIEDTFTIILQYSSPLLVTIKTTTVSPMKNQLKYIVRGTKGSFIKYGTDAQEQQTIDGMPSTDTKFGVEDESLKGVLTTCEEFDPQSQVYDASIKMYCGNYPTIPGYNRGYYENVVDAIRGRAELNVKPAHSRDGIRLVELARKSHETGTIVPWS